MTRRLALGLSGGGDSLALLHALRAAFPEIEVHALIVDHGLRAESAREAETAARWAQEAGAWPEILVWDAPRKGQGHARDARHRLLAEACQRLQIDLLCLAHTLDDRIETLRMRASRPGDAAQLTGPGLFDPSPVWPEGGRLTIARPFLTLRRRELRAFLQALGHGWIDDPSNDDTSYERTRLRQDAWPEGDAQETALLAESDKALSCREKERAEARALIDEAARLTGWGGLVLDRAAFERAPEPVAHTALDALMLAASGHSRSPGPAQITQTFTALRQGQPTTVAGVALTAAGVLGRDPGAVIGRADGQTGLNQEVLKAGSTTIFDGRWAITAHTELQFGPWGQDGRLAGDVPSTFRPSLLAVVDPQTGELLALPGVNTTDVADFEQLARQRIASRLLPPTVPTWFDADRCARKVELTLAKAGGRPNITQ